MREILFRGKSVIDNKWVYGYYYKAKLCVTDKKLCDYITTPYPIINGKKSDHIMIIPETIGQYIGLKDKNGTKIFEGDIIGYRSMTEDFLGIVVSEEWNYSCCNGVFGFSVDGIKGYRTPDLRNYDISEVIGNIFENTELLKESEKGDYEQ